MLKITLFFFLLTQLSYAKTNEEKLQSIKRLDHFVFGSCNKEFYKQPLWKKIIAKGPQLFLWVGDIIYGDKKPHKDNLKKKYDILRSHPDYSQLIAKTPVIGTWDDHDYGSNNGDGRYQGKFNSQQLLLDFLEEPTDSPRRSQAGVYTSYTFGSGETQVKFILLDDRFNMHKGKGEVLGEKQWSWLENELKESKAKVNFLISSLPILPNALIRSEEWADFPKERKRLLALLTQNRPSGLVLLSGDKHFAAITQRHSFLEIMSSGLTHHTPTLLIPLLKRYYSPAYFKLNFAHLKIDWNQQPIQLEVDIQGLAGSKLKRTYQLMEGKFLLHP